MRKIMCLGLAVVFLAGCSSLGRKQDMQIQDLQGRINNLETELEKKDQEIKSLEGQLRSARGEILPSEPDAKLSRVQIQEALKNAGYYQGPVDGKIGAKTEEAIMAFQKANNLKVDGKVGKMTSAELKRYLKE